MENNLNFDLLPVVAATIDRYQMLDKNMKVVVAVSGGVDSVVLLHLLLRLSQERGFNLFVAHFNHMLRGEEAEADANFVADLAEKWGLTCKVVAADVRLFARERSLSLQEAARLLRYEFLYRYAQEMGAERVATAHHADDLVETIIYNFLRGAGLTGLRGFLPVRAGFYIRPLIGITRRQIETYACQYNLSYRIDRSNFKVDYLRNRIRLQLIPQLKQEYNPNLTAALQRTAAILRDEDQLLDLIAQKDLERLRLVLPRENGLFLSRTGWVELHPALQRRVLRLVYRALVGNTKGLGFEHIEYWRELWLNGSNGQKLQLPQGIIAGISGDCLWVMAGTYGEFYKEKTYCYLLPVPGETFVPEVGFTFRTRVIRRDEVPSWEEMTPWQAAVDWQKLKGEKLTVRNRRAGDRFYPLGAPGRMKLKKFLQSVRLPESARNTWPLVVKGEEEVIWVPGFRPAETVKITNDTSVCLWLEARYQSACQIKNFTV